MTNNSILEAFSGMRSDQDMQPLAAAGSMALTLYSTHLVVLASGVLDDDPLARYLLIVLPALTLAGFWLGGERVLILLALGGPLIFALAGVAGDPAAPDLDDGPPLARAIRSMDRLLPMT